MMLGIPTVLDRFIQQAVSQVLTPVFDPGFSPSNFGFGPGRSAHDAILQAQTYLNDGFSWVVDLDLEKFFDRVNHDILMARLARHVKDKPVLRLIRRYLQAGILTEGVVMARTEGTPQGGRFRPCWPISCWMTSTRNWNGAGWRSSVTRTTEPNCATR